MWNEGGDIVVGGKDNVVGEGEGTLWREGKVQSSRGDGTSGSPTSVTGSIIPLTVTCNGFTINLVSDDWSVAEPTSHQFTYAKNPGPTSAAKCSGNQTICFADSLLKKYGI